MPAIAPLEDLKAAQKDLLEAKDLNELKAVFKKWRRIGWKNICKLNDRGRIGWSFKIQIGPGRKGLLDKCGLSTLPGA